jgi:hypothetical protein
MWRQPLWRFQSPSKTVAYRRPHGAMRLRNPATLIVLRGNTTSIWHVGSPTLAISPCVDEEVQSADQGSAP